MPSAYKREQRDSSSRCASSRTRIGSFTKMSFSLRVLLFERKPERICVQALCHKQKSSTRCNRLRIRLLLQLFILMYWPRHPTFRSDSEMPYGVLSQPVPSAASVHRVVLWGRISAGKLDSRVPSASHPATLEIGNRWCAFLCPFRSAKLSVDVV